MRQTFQQHADPGMRTTALATFIFLHLTARFIPRPWLHDRNEWLREHQARIIALIGACVDASPGYAEAQERRLREIVRAALRAPEVPPGFKPPWIPMTLGELRSLATADREYPAFRRSTPAASAGAFTFPMRPLRNPAPRPLNEKHYILPSQFWTFLLEEAGLLPDEDGIFVPIPHDTYRWVQQLGWEMSDTEGYPPAPWSGDTYSGIETEEVEDYAHNAWPLIESVRAEARFLDQQGIPFHLLVGSKSMDDHARERPHYYVGNESPADWAREMIRYARRVMLPVVLLADTLRSNPSMFQRHADPDAHVRTMFAPWFQKTKDAVDGQLDENRAEDFLWRLYGIKSGEDKIDGMLLPDPWKIKGDVILSPYLNLGGHYMASYVPLSAQVVASDRAKRSGAEGTKRNPRPALKR